jgi:hypothetical protein
MTKNKLTIEELSEALGIKIPEVEPDNFDGVFMDAKNYYLQKGLSEEDAEEKAQESVDENMDGYLKEINRTFDSYSEELLGEVFLDLSQKGDSGIYTVTPKHSWKESAEALRELINGYGVFHFGSLRDFLKSSGPTAREATLTHIHWMRYYPEVYGGGSTQREFDRRLQRNCR